MPETRETVTVRATTCRGSLVMACPVLARGADGTLEVDTAPLRRHMLAMGHMSDAMETVVFEVEEPVH